MGRTIVKNFFREIWDSKSRFISIFTIIMVGVTSYSGLRTTGPDMKLTADTYFDGQNFMDISIQSTLGLTDADVDEAAGTEGVASAVGAWSVDAYLHSDEDYIVKVHSLSQGINEPVLVEGRMPETPEECLLGSDAIGLFSVAIGDTVLLRTEKGIYEDSLEFQEYTIVGVAQSPHYISLSKGTSTLGNGIVLDYVYLPEDAFGLDYYTEINVLIQGAAVLDTFSGEYNQTVSSMISRLEELGEVRAKARYDEIIGDAEAELADAQQKLDDAEADKVQQLQEAQAKIDESWREIKDGEAAVEDSEAELNNSVASATARLSSAKRKLTASESDIKAKESELSTAKSQLKKSEAEYESAVQAANTKFSEAEAKAATETAAAEAQITALRTTLKEIESSMETLEGQIAYLWWLGEDTSTLDAQYNNYKSQYNQAQSKINEVQAKITAAKKTMEAEKAAVQAELNKAKSELEAARAKISSSQSSIDSAKAQVKSGWDEYYAGQREMETSKREGEAKIEEAKAELEEARQKLGEAEAEFAEAEADANQQLDKAKQELREAQDRVNEIKEGSWYVRNRSANPGFSAFSDDADRITALASVFPIIFFLVAALVSLTTMTRMVESKRTENGTMRALGYGKLSIAMIYIMYGFFASLGGSIAGFFLGIHMIPTIVFTAYSELLYTLPDLIIPIHGEYLVSSILISIICVTAATIWACYSSFMETPSSLMKPRTPRPGKRVFLERIGFIWGHLPFKYKVTARNILRYKKRFFMTLIGICGCTGLLIAGFGLRNSIMGVVDIQYDELTPIDMSVTLNESASDESKEKITEYLEESDLVAASGLFRMGSTTVSTSRRSAETYYVIPLDMEKMPAFYALRDRLSKAKVPLTEGGVVITEKLAELLGLDVGDEITVDLGQPVSVPVTGICENYVYHYIFMTKETYEILTEEALEASSVYVRFFDDSAYDEVSGYILENNSSAVSYITRFSDVRDLLLRSMQSIDAAVVIIIVAAAVLAFVVLYNLNNINITERMRELSTIKVMGYYDLNVTAYLFRENVVLTLLGILMVGQIFGMFLHRYLVHTVEIEMMMFGRAATRDSYIYSIFLTLLFSVIVNIFVHVRLKQIDMVESVKMPD